MSHMIVLYVGVIVNGSNNRSNHINNNKGPIYNVTKAAAMKSISMQIPKVKAVNSSH